MDFSFINGFLPQPNGSAVVYPFNKIPHSLLMKLPEWTSKIDWAVAICNTEMDPNSFIWLVDKFENIFDCGQLRFYGVDGCTMSVDNETNTIRANWVVTSLGMRSKNWEIGLKGWRVIATKVFVDRSDVILHDVTATHAICSTAPFPYLTHFIGSETPILKINGDQLTVDTSDILSLHMWLVDEYERYTNTR